MSRIAVAALVAVFALFASQFAHAQIQISTAGASTMTPLMSNLVFSFRSVNSEVSVGFTVTGNQAARDATIGVTTPAVDVGLSNVPYTDADVANAQSKGYTGKLLSVPFTSSAQVLSYSLGSFTKLNLDRATIFGIFNRSIIFWNDARILALNPNMPATLTSKINIVYRTDASGSTNTFVQMMNSFGGGNNAFLPVSDLPAWRYGSMLTCPPASAVTTASPWTLPASTLQGYACESNNDLLTSPQVNFNPNSIGYMPLSMLYPGQPIATIKNKAGVVVSANDASVQSAITSAAGTPSTTSPVGDLTGVVDSQDPGAWPAVEMGFYTLPLIVNKDCPRSLQIAQYLIWSIQSMTATSAMSFLGYTPLPTAMQATVIDSLTQLRCGDASSSQAVFDALMPDEVALQIVSFISAGVLIIMAGIFIWKRNHPAVQRDSFPVLLFICIGAAGNILTVSAYIGHPTQATCDAIPWIKIFELITIFGIFIVRVKKWLKIVDEDTLLDETFEHPELTAADAPAGGDSAKGVIAITVDAAAQTRDISAGRVQKDQSALRMRLFLICFAVFCLWLLLPVTWVVIEPPLMTQRVCQGSLQGTYHLIYLAFNILMIVITASLAYFNKELDTVVHPIFIMLFINALFQPMEFIIKAQQFPNRSAVALTLQPAVGILMGTLLEVGLITGLALVGSLRYTAEEMLEQINVRKEVAKFKRQSTAKLLSRKISRRKQMAKKDEAEEIGNPVSAQSASPPVDIPSAAAQNWVANPIAK